MPRRRSRPTRSCRCSAGMRRQTPGRHRRRAARRRSCCSAASPYPRPSSGADPPGPGRRVGRRSGTRAGRPPRTAPYPGRREPSRRRPGLATRERRPMPRVARSARSRRTRVTPPSRHRPRPGRGPRSRTRFVPVRASSGAPCVHGWIGRASGAAIAEPRRRNGDAFRDPVVGLVGPLPNGGDVVGTSPREE